MEEIINFVSQYWLYILVGLLLIFVISGICIANFSYDKYLKTFEEMSKIGTSFRGDAYTFAKRFSLFFFGGKINVKVMPEKEMQSYGSYTPATSTVSLSSKIANTGSVATLAIVAHEFGHAYQHLNNPKILASNFKLSRTVKFLGFLNIILLGGAIYFFATGIIILSIFLLAFIFLNFMVAIWLKISTLKLEKNASEIAVDLLEKTKGFKNKEIALMKRFMQSAKQTYTGDLFRALFAWTGLVRKTKIF